MNKQFLFLSLLILSLSLVSAVGTYPAVTDDMVLYYHFNNDSAYGENDTHVYDFSNGHLNNGTVYNGAVFNLTDGILKDGALGFDGVDDYVISNNTNSLKFDEDINFTVSFWFRCSQNPSAVQHIFGKIGDGGINSFGSYIDTSGYISAKVGLNATTSSTFNYCDNKFHNVVYTVTRNNNLGLKLYIDGLFNKNSSTLGNTNLTKTSYPLYIGKRSTGNNFNGSLDEFIIYNKSLSASEIWSNYLNYSHSGGCLVPTVKTFLGGSTVLCSAPYYSNGSSVDNSYGTINIINANDLSLDCNNSLFYGNASRYSRGIYILDSSNINVSNCYFTNFHYNIYMTNLSNGLLNNLNSFNASGREVTVYNSVNGSVTITNSHFYDSYHAFDWVGKGFLSLDNRGGNISILNSLFENISISFYADNSTTSIFLINNTFRDAIYNADSYSSHVFSWSSSNLFIYNNSFFNACTSILFHSTNDSIIQGNNFSLDSDLGLSKGINCAFEPLGAIGIQQAWKGWVPVNQGDANENITMNQRYNSYNISILNNNFGNYPVKLRTQGSVNIIQDISNFWLRSFQTPIYLFDREYWYISDNYNNLTTVTNQSSPQSYNTYYSNLLGNNWRGTVTNQKVNYNIFQSYLWFKNVNLTEIYITSVFNQTNSLFTNGTSLCNGSTGLMTGNVNITLNPNDFCYVLDDFNLSESSPRENSPFAFTVSTDSSKHISSTLDTNLTVQVNFNVKTCESLGKITYTSGLDGYSRIYYPSDYSCSDNVVTINSVTLETSSSSNEFEIEYGCSTMQAIAYKIVMIFASLLLLSFCSFFVWKSYQDGDLTVGKLIVFFVIIIVCIALWLVSGQSLGASCGVVG